MPGALPVCTAALNSDPAEKAGVFLAGILILSVGFCGFTPILAFLFLASKVPKPTKVTLRPLVISSTITARIAFRALSTSTFDRPVPSATFSINSDLFICFSPIVY